MKFFVLLIASFAFISAKSQQLSGKINNVSFYKDTVLGRQPNLTVFTINQTNYKFLFKNERGSVYESPVDRMRCLAPDFPSSMPNSSFPKINKENQTKPEQIPNPLLYNNSVPRALQLKR